MHVLRRLLLFLFVILAGLGLHSSTAPPPDTPNVIVLLADDMGYGDLSSYGHPTIDTPNLDRLADQGTRFTSFETGIWCVPSRLQLLTGRYRPRVDLDGGTGADGEGGLPQSEVTLAEALNDAGYATGMAGKWHLGYQKDRFLPPNQGFDSWLGLPYSNDQKRPVRKTDEKLALYRGTERIEYPVDQTKLTTGYTQEAVRFIKEKRGDQPFFFYLAYNMPHVPLHTAPRFRGQSDAGLYGDVIETIDWSVGRILTTLENRGLTDDTIVFFASDNGPWLDLPKRTLRWENERWHVGSPGPLRGAKHTTYEGGSRVPALIRWPGHVESGIDTHELVAMPDVYRTLLAIAEAERPDHPLDGHNLMPFLRGEEEQSPRERYYYFHKKLEAMREGRWKLRLTRGKPQLFDLHTDVGERVNRASGQKERVRRMRARMKAFADSVGTSLR